MEHKPTHTLFPLTPPKPDSFRYLPIKWKEFQDKWLKKLEYLEAWEFVHEEMNTFSSPVLFRWVWFLYGLGHLLTSYRQVSDYIGILRLVYPVEESNENTIPKFHKEFVKFFESFFEALYSFCSTEICFLMCETQWNYLSYYPSLVSFAEPPGESFWNIRENSRLIS